MLSRHKIIYLENNDKICVLNCSDSTNDVMIQTNLNNLTKQKFKLAIALNLSKENTCLDNLQIPVYHVDKYVNSYYCLDLVNAHETNQIFRFIFVDTDSLYFGHLEDDNLNKTTFIQNLFLVDQNKKTNFYEWFINSIIQSEPFTRIFIVTNKTPFYYLQLDNSNPFINKFLGIIMNSGNTNIDYLSTDNDHFQNVLYYPNTYDYDTNSQLSMILIGTLGNMNYKPVVFDRVQKLNFFDGRYNSKIQNDQPGYVEIKFGVIPEIIYKYVTPVEVIKFVIKNAIMLVEKANDLCARFILDYDNVVEYYAELLSLQFQLEIYKKFIEKNDCVNKYLSINNHKRLSVQMFNGRMASTLRENMKQTLYKIYSLMRF